MQISQLHYGLINKHLKKSQMLGSHHFIQAQLNPLYSIIVCTKSHTVK